MCQRTTTAFRADNEVYFPHYFPRTNINNLKASEPAARTRPLLSDEGLAFLRRSHFGLGVVVALAALIALAPPMRDQLVYNPSSSMPAGFYLRVDGAPAIGDIVSVRARDVAPGYAALRGFDDVSDRFIKRVAAGDGDYVCASGAEVRVNGVLVATRLRLDGQRRPLPTWKGCERLAGRYLLLGDSGDSFDGRYWGLVDAARLEAVWRPLGR
jgi:type IV secretory pathway protease TraF